MFQGGVYYFNIFDNYAAAGWCLLIISFFQVIAVSWIFGIDKFWDKVCEMIGYRPFPWFKWCWFVISPISIAVSWRRQIQHDTIKPIYFRVSVSSASSTTSLFVIIKYMFIQRGVWSWLGCWLFLLYFGFPELPFTSFFAPMEHLWR